MTKDLLLTDYRKWLIYNFGDQDFDNYCSLYKALQKGDTFGTVSVSKSGNEGPLTYTVSFDKNEKEIHLTDEQRLKFLQYLTDNYFQTDDIDGLIMEKRRESEIAINHNFIKSQDHANGEEKTDFKIKPHPKETLYFNIKASLSILFYALFAALIAYGILSDPSIIIYLLSVPMTMIVITVANTFIKGIFIGLVRGSSIRITEDQFPDIYKIVEEQARILEIATPEIYITSGHFNAFVTKFARAHIMMIYSEVIETTLKGNSDVLKYITAHELCHIKRRHITKEKVLFPSRIIPFLSLAYSRACEYTCDRVGYHFSPKGAVEGILIMTTGKEIHSKFNIELHIQKSIESNGFWTWISEKFLTHPHLYKRLIEIKKYSKYN